jgi:hypothetical protein
MSIPITGETLRQLTAMRQEKNPVRKMIAVPYSVDQNEPSKPLRQLVDYDNASDVFEATVKQLYIDHVCDEANVDDIVVQYQFDSQYSDVVVFQDLYPSASDAYLYLTFID